MICLLIWTTLQGMAKGLIELAISFQDGITDDQHYGWARSFGKYTEFANMQN